ncbi:hypothetical protein O181_018150 [Austropuccinia psidii MF-1]|uniref:OTU domain-containing protein n=1 Tax=Austropuccinia psidii MF-1 TaxID=1389203 RepID=A0A9Q3GTR3_9BASI|nr:hypothetical protein [Austropuccinia psidii MF-1]
MPTNPLTPLFLTPCPTFRVDAAQRLRDYRVSQGQPPSGSYDTIELINMAPHPSASTVSHRGTQAWPSFFPRKARYSNLKQQEVPKSAFPKEADGASQSQIPPKVVLHSELQPPQPKPKADESDLITSDDPLGREPNSLSTSLEVPPHPLQTLSNQDNAKMEDLLKLNLVTFDPQQTPGIIVRDIGPSSLGLVQSTNIKGDGNCQYRAIAQITHKNQEMYSEVKTQVLNYMSHDDKEVVLSFMDMKDEKTIAEAFDNYYDQIKQDNAYGDEYTLQAMAKLYKLNIACLAYSVNDLTEKLSLLKYEFANGVGDAPWHTVYLYREHYQLLFKKGPKNFQHQGVTEIKS